MRYLIVILLLYTGLPLLTPLSAQTSYRRMLVHNYADTSYYGQRLQNYYGTQGLQPTDVLHEMDRHFLAESSYGRSSQLIGDDGRSLGWFQNSIHVVLTRQYPKGYTNLDSIATRHRLLTDWQFNTYHFLKTKHEMFDLHVKRGRTGGSARRASIRSVNAGSRRSRYMGRMATIYRDKILDH